jgi:hypothetical protein
MNPLDIDAQNQRGRNPGRWQKSQIGNAFIGMEYQFRRELFNKTALGK